MSEKIYTDLNGEYLQKNPTWHIQDSPWKAAQVLKMLKRNPIEPKCIAEIGCGAGVILNTLYSTMPEDVSFTGYDIANDAITLAAKQQKPRLDFNLGDLLETDEKFDLLLMMDVFEHVDDYMGFVKACKNKATYTIFHIPLDLSAQAIVRNKLIQERKKLGHLHYFMKETALATLVDSGYEVMDFFYTNGALEQPSNTFKSKLASWPRKILYKINKDFAVKMLGGCSLLVLAR